MCKKFFKKKPEKTELEKLEQKLKDAKLFMVLPLLILIGFLIGIGGIIIFNPLEVEFDMISALLIFYVLVIINLGVWDYPIERLKKEMELEKLNSEV